MKAIVFIITFIAGVCITANAQTVDDNIRQGNDLYKKEQYQQAEASYNSALEAAPNNVTARINKANALYKQGKQEEAIRLLNDIAYKSEDHETKARAYYNKGAILSAQKKLEESIEAYKDALRHNPNDKDARENLQKALLELKKKNPQPKDNKKQQQQQQKQKQQQQQQQQPKMSQKEAEQRLKLLEQKEKEVQQRLQKEKSKSGGGQQKDW